jgi:1-acyl-sn-glycerol-3-phosphate acyltransferase
MMLYDWVQRFGAERPVYALMNPKIWQVMPGLARLAAQVGAIRAQPRLAIAALNRPASLLIYPGGAQDVFRPYAQRHQIHFHRRQGFIKLALEQEVPIIPLISHGAHSTLVVLADIYPQLEQLHRFGFPWPFGIDPEVCPIYLGWPWGLAVGPWPNIPFPVQIHTRVCRSITFGRYGVDAAQDDAYVASCYDSVLQVMQAELGRLDEEHGNGC